MGSDEEDRQSPTDEDLSQALNNLSAQERTDLFQKFSAADKKDQDLANAEKKTLLPRQPKTFQMRTGRTSLPQQLKGFQQRTGRTSLP